MPVALPPEQTNAAAWYGPDMAACTDWLMHLGAGELAEFEAATQALAGTRSKTVVFGSAFTFFN